MFPCKGDDEHRAQSQPQAPSGEWSPLKRTKTAGPQEQGLDTQPGGALLGLEMCRWGEWGRQPVCLSGVMGSGYSTPQLKETEAREARENPTSALWSEIICV